MFLPHCASSIIFARHSNDNAITPLSLLVNNHRSIANVSIGTMAKKDLFSGARLQFSFLIFGHKGKCFVLDDPQLVVVSVLWLELLQDLEIERFNQRHIDYVHCSE